jgi:serine/threonine-protein kinase
MDRIGRYKIVRELGRGAMGVVYHAIDPNIGRPVAIKTIQLGGRNADEQGRMRERLFREARSAGILSHPGIVTIYDVEQQGELAYIAMEYVDGPTLDHVLSEQAIPGGRMFGILGQTAAALDYAHQKGIVHRDIKPANIMLAAGDTAKVTDFGIAKITASEQFTMTGSIVGTPHYMSPEQVQGQNVDGRSDQFSLAVIAYEMLTGEKPYTGEQLTTVVFKIVADEPAPPQRLNPTLSGAIESALRKALAKKPDGRYRTCSEFVNALEKACDATRGWKAMARGGSLNSPTVTDAAPLITLPPGHAPSRAESTTTVERSGKRRSGFLAFIGAILVAAALLALIGWQADPSLPGKLQWVSQQWTALVGRGTAPETTAPPAEAPAAALAGGQAQTPPAAEPSANSTAAVSPPPAPASLPAETKPSPMPSSEASPAEPKPSHVPASETGAGEAVRAEPPARSEEPAVKQAAEPKMAVRERPALPVRPQQVDIISSPGGATATLDGRPDTACKTPCSLNAAPGRHIVAITMPGYQVEHRQIEVGSGPLEIPPVVLRSTGGTLMLSSDPAGAAVLVNGQAVPQTTPAQLALAPGTYQITVQKDGRQNTSSVEIRSGEIRSLRVLLGQ